jgi:acyl-CoA reductase-like NAD-dependent aldehyde dehydrogenase
MHENLRADVRTRSVMVDVPAATVGCYAQFGRRKGSSYRTREQGKYAVEFCTTVKTV